MMDYDPSAADVWSLGVTLLFMVQYISAVRIITVCHRPFTGSKGQMSDQDLLWYDIISSKIIIMADQLFPWSDILS